VLTAQAVVNPVVPYAAVRLTPHLTHASSLSGPVPSYRPNSELRSASQARSQSQRAPQTPTPYSQATISLTRFCQLAHVDVLVGLRWLVFGQDIESLVQR
jgi:hypothetical protein